MIKKLIQRSTDVTGRLMDGVKHNKPIVGVLFETWELSSKEIKNHQSLITTTGFVAKDFEFSKFISHGDNRKEHVALKAPMLIGQMKQHYDNLETHCHQTFNEEKEHENKTRLLLECTNHHANDNLKETIKKVQARQDFVPNKTHLELVINEFIGKCLIVNNRHVNFMHAIIHFKHNSESMISMLAQLRDFYKITLGNYKTSKRLHSNLCYDEIDLFVLLLSICDEKLLEIFLLKYKDNDYEECLKSHQQETLMWFLQHDA